VPVARRWLPLAIFVLVPSVLILPILFSGKMLYGADVVSVFHYSRIVIGNAFRSGKLPVWDPHVMAGFPMLAEPQNALFYPPTWLCALMSAGTFWTLSAWAHLIAAGMFAHRWLERGLGLGPWSALAGAFVFMMSGYLAGHLYAGHVNYVWAYPWVPAVLWRLERFLAGPTLKRGVLLSTVLAMLFLAGVPQFVLFAALMVLARMVLFLLGSPEGRRERAVRAAKGTGWLALGLLLCAPQMLPTLELVSQMQRSGGSDPMHLDHSLSVKDLGNLLLPPDRGPYSGRMWWETCGYVGGAVLLLSLAVHAGKHPQRHLWFAVALLSILLAMGSSTPLYQAFLGAVPGAGWFRAPGRYLLLFTVAMSALTAIGFDALWKRESLRFRIPAGVLALAAGVQLLDFDRPCFNPPWSEDPRTTLAQAEKSLHALRNDCGLEARVANAREDVGLIGLCQAAGVDQVCGYEPMLLRRYAEVMNVARGAPADEPMVILAAVAPHPAVRMLATRYLVAVGIRRDYPDFMPRSWVVNNAVVFEDKAQRLQAIAGGKWDPLRTVILEAYPKEAPPVPTEARAGTSKVLAKGPGSYEIQAENGAEAYLVLSEAFYPGWDAEVDGRPAEVLPANHLIQTVRLTAGKHIVRFRYRSRFLGLGFALAALAVLVPVGLLVHRHRGQLPLQRLPGAP
jgi:hypothetical protein